MTINIPPWNALPARTRKLAIPIAVMALLIALSPGGARLLALAVLACGLLFALRTWQRRGRREFLERFVFPSFLLRRVHVRHPALSERQLDDVSGALKQFFRACQDAGGAYVAMPSEAADTLWHEFILHTRSYDAFCRRAFGGFLHHTPAVVLSEHRKSNEGLRRVWWYCCKYENIDPVRPTRLPLLFALDSKLKITNGFVYQPDC